MDEIREVALAYYAKSTDDVKQTTKSFFQGMDTDGNGKISITEFEDYVKSKWRRFKPELFTELDHDGDGLLDFEEVIVFFYMVKMRNSFCDSCGEFMKALFFTCVECFVKRSCNQTFDVCLECYRTGAFQHEHQRFLDNYALLNTIWSDSKKEKSSEEALKMVSEGLHLGGQVVELMNGLQCSIL